MSGKTPHPWRYQHGKVIDADGYRICTVDSEVPLRAYIDSNGVMLAAAPEMYELLDHIAYMLSETAVISQTPQSDLEILRQITALIIKVNGSLKLIE
jgi:hypothetical protein